MHEYVPREFEDVLQVLRAKRALLGVEAKQGEDRRRDYANRRTARLPVRVDGFDANLLVLRIVGGTQEPITELILTTDASRQQPSASAAQRFVEDLALALEKEVPAASGSRPIETPERTKEWTPRKGRPRVLIESNLLGMGYAAESMLRKAGYDTALCGGPEHLPRRRCPLVATGACAHALEADVVVHALDLNQPRNADVLRALREHYPEKPVVVEVATSDRARHRELLEGCSVVGYMMVRGELLGAVEEALRRAAGQAGRP